ncbi:MAG: hypothetical protein MUF87_11095 [Anaerolineae bacterium]|jgi:hypothetical protein|nr:hypothetical protein [Anaerolineae bacterium]
MQHHHRWYIQNRVVYVIYRGAVLLEELDILALDLVQNYLDKGQAPVHMIIDIRELTTFPTHLGKVKQNADLYIKHPSLGHVLFIGVENPAIRFIASTIMQLARLNYYILKSQDSLPQVLLRIEPRLEVEDLTPNT